MPLAALRSSAAFPFSAEIVDGALNSEAPGKVRRRGGSGPGPRRPSRRVTERPRRRTRPPRRAGPCRPRTRNAGCRRGSSRSHRRGSRRYGSRALASLGCRVERAGDRRGVPRRDGPKESQPAVGVRCVPDCTHTERATGIEPTFSAWERPEGNSAAHGDLTLVLVTYRVECALFFSVAQRSRAFLARMWHADLRLRRSRGIGARRSCRRSRFTPSRGGAARVR